MTRRDWCARKQCQPGENGEFLGHGKKWDWNELHHSCCQHSFCLQVSAGEPWQLSPQPWSRLFWQSNLELLTIEPSCQGRGTTGLCLSHRYSTNAGPLLHGYTRNMRILISNGFVKWVWDYLYLMKDLGAFHLYVRKGYAAEGWV